MRDDVGTLAERAHAHYWRLKRRRLEARASQSAAAVQPRIDVSNDAFFKELGLERESIEAASEARCRKLGVPFDRLMQSVHYVAFEALAASGFKPRNILEVGTYLGYTALYLADLFPDAIVYTIDLPEHDPLTKEYLPLDEATKAEVVRRLDRPNIRWIRENTALMWRHDLPKFDLIWQDTGDRFPEIAMEFFHSLAHLTPDGWLFVDDIRKPDNPILGYKDWYAHVHMTLDYYNKRLAQPFNLLLKRKDPIYYQTDPKYVAFLRPGSLGRKP